MKEGSFRNKHSFGEIALGLMIGQVVLSTLLSAFILLRFQLSPMPGVNIGNIVLYFLNYFLVPISSLCWSIYPLLTSILQEPKKQIGLHILFLATWLVGLIVLSLSINGFLPQYLSLPVPAALVGVIYLDQHTSQKSSFAKIFIVAMMCGFVILAPFFSALIGYNTVLSQATKIDNETERVLFISKSVFNITTDWPVLKGMLRANDDFVKFLLNGDGACGETAMATTTYLKKLGFDALEAGFPGEDHTFAEVKINGAWEALDPGYYFSTLLTMQQRVDHRISETGTVSYIAAFTENSFIELTPEYVSTDTIQIKVTRDGKPLPEASVNLIHTLRYGSSAYDVGLPGGGYSFHTDANGTVNIHLGNLSYSGGTGGFANTDHFYWIWVNGENTNQKVTSNGTGETEIVEIDMP